MGGASRAEHWSLAEGTRIDTTGKSGGLAFRKTWIPLLALPFALTSVNPLTSLTFGFLTRKMESTDAYFREIVNITCVKFVSQQLILDA